MARPITGPPTPRALAAKQTYLELGPGRSLARVLEVLQRRGQVTGRPPACTTIRTLEYWSKRDGWVQAAVAWDCAEAQRRHRERVEAERALVREDIARLQNTLRAAAKAAEHMIEPFVPGEDGTPARSAGTLRDGVMLIKLCLDGLQLIVPQRPTEGPSEGDLAVALAQATEEQREAILGTMHALQGLLNTVQRGG